MLRIYFVLAAISFIATYFLTPKIISIFKQIGLIARDIHKKNKPLLPTSIGIPVFFGAFISIMFFIFFSTFVYKDSSNLIPVFGAASTLLLITFVGFLDDLIMSRKKDFRESEGGLKKWQKPLLVLPAVIPLMVIMAGTETMTFPLIGSVNFGILYPLLLVPIGIFGAANMVNLLGGFNGMEAGMGVIYMAALSLYSFFNGTPTSTIIAVSMLGALLAILKFNFYPAKILPGDSIQYLLGASLACIAILGNIERAVIIVSIPFFIELILKLRGKLNKTTIGILNSKGKIQSKYKKIYSWPHLLMRSGKYTEKQIVFFMMFVEVIFASLIWVV